MGITTVFQILSNDMVRRLLNTEEGQSTVVVGGIIDKYAEKLERSGFTRKQSKRIILNGMKMT